MKTTNEEIRVSLSTEHSDVLEKIQECFEPLNTEVKADYARKSTGDLPMQILIFVGRAALDGMTWDLIKIGVKKIYQKFPNARVTLRDSKNTIYNIKINLKIDVIVVHERRNEFEDIKNFDDMAKHIDSEKDER